MIGKRILHYDIKSKLGAGGMGEVYLARDTKLDRDVALKFLPQSLRTDPSARVRLIREAQAASRLIHSNIVAIHSIEEAEGHDFIVMEYVAGRSLDEVIADDALTVSRALEITRQIAEAMAAAHALGIVHRDIKTNNIIVTPSGQAKVLDFGLATFSGATRVTDSGSTLGTVAYMSPEQAQGRDVDARSDLFSVGIVLYEMIAGRRPFRGEERQAIAQAILTQIPEPLARYKAGVPDEVQRIVDKALRKRPDERYQSAADMLADVRVARQDSDASELSGAGDAFPTPQGAGPPSGSGDPWSAPDASHAAHGGGGAGVTPPPGTAIPHTGPGQTPMPTPYPPTAPPSRAPMWIALTVIVVALIAAAAYLIPRLGGESLRSSVTQEQHGTETAGEGERAMVEGTGGARGTTPVPQGRTMLAVLPFDNLGEADDAYFADGVTEEITVRLAGVDGLGVIARTSILHYRGTQKTVGEIGEELGVDYILAGSVRWQHGAGGESRVRVTPQLVRVSDATNVWADVYDQSIDDIFDVQSTIAKEVVDALDVTLVGREATDLETRPTDNMEAYDHFLRGWELFNRKDFDAATYRSAERAFTRAVELDPEFALAWAWLVVLHADTYWFHFDRSPSRIEKSRVALERAEALDPDSPEVMEARGWYLYHGKSAYEEALVWFNRALAHRPNDADLRSGVGFVYRRQGKWDLALENLRLAFELDPRSTHLAYEAGETAMYMRRYDKADELLTRALELGPEASYVYTTYAVLELARGDTGAAGAMLSRGIEATDEDDLRAIQALVHIFEGRFDAALDLLAAMHEREYETQVFYYSVELLEARCYRARGDVASAESRFEAARERLEVLSRSAPNDPRYHGALAITHAGLERREDAMRHARRAVELQPLEADAYKAPHRRYEMAVVYAMLGEVEAAIDEIEYVLSVPSDHSVHTFRMDPVFETVIKHPRFAKLLADHS